ncbi:MAG: hypothetical protein H6765_00325 [Candidatus Peribacteria bacterium]|nr:MAG: hypothetical protein H6765_00325 [Candidatus Peribacteria bacterium]
MGNKASVTELDLLRYREEKEGEGAIALYLEQISDGKEFLKLSKEISKKQPILLLKPGRSRSAQAAMHSHTGSIA